MSAPSQSMRWFTKLSSVQWLQEQGNREMREGEGERDEREREREMLRKGEGDGEGEEKPE